MTASQFLRDGDRVTITNAFPPDHWNGISGRVVGDERFQVGAGRIATVACDDGRARVLFVDSLDYETEHSPCL